MEAEDTGKRKFMGEIMMSNQELRDSQRVLLLFIKVDRRKKKSKKNFHESRFLQNSFTKIFSSYLLSLSLFVVVGLFRFISHDGFLVHELLFSVQETLCDCPHLSSLNVP